MVQPKLDVLFVVSTRAEMAAERVALADALPTVLTGLARGDVDRDGVREGPLLDVQVGIISAYVGTAGHPWDGCDNAAVGEDALLRTEVVGSPPGCAAAYDAVARGTSTTDEAAWIGPACLVRGLPGSCPFQQPLLAAAKAVAPAAAPPMTLVNPTSHGDRENAPLLRPDAVLAVVFVADRDDCSPRRDEIFREGAVVASVDRQCRLDEDRELMSIAALIPALRALRAHQPRRLFVGVLGPVAAEDAPLDAVQAGFGQREASRVEDPTTLEPYPTCEGPGGAAFPAPRIMEAAAASGDDAVATSICADARTQLAEILRRAAARADPCLPAMEVLNSRTGATEDVSQHCRVTAALPRDGAFTTCEALSARGGDATPVREADGIQVCAIQRVESGDTEPGWFFDSTSPETRAICAHRTAPLRIGFTSGGDPPEGSSLRLECPVPAAEFGCVWPSDEVHSAWRASVAEGESRCAQLCYTDEHCAVGEICDIPSGRPGGRCRTPACR